MDIHVQGAVCTQQSLPEIPGQTFSLLAISVTGFFHEHCTTHGTNGLTSRPKDKAITVKCLD